MASLSNQYAAMPSLHFGWSTWCAITVVLVIGRGRLRWLAFLYPLVTLFCILITANHFWLDAFFGAVALGGGWLVALAVDRWVHRDRSRRRPRPWSSRPGGQERHHRSAAPGLERLGLTQGRRPAGVAGVELGDGLQVAQGVEDRAAHPPGVVVAAHGAQALVDHPVVVGPDGAPVVAVAIEVGVGAGVGADADRGPQVVAEEAVGHRAGPLGREQGAQEVPGVRVTMRETTPSPPTARA
ncbi:MAG: inositol phosphorylceramide synthase [Acidimicrobiales bacterium]|nr:inositol phosphorylceramide synthase [Acidimicrobiales bacterium]